MEDDTDEEDMEYVNLDDKRERHWRMESKDNGGGVDDAKALLHAKIWDLCVNEREIWLRVDIWWKLLVMIRRR